MLGEGASDLVMLTSRAVQVLVLRNAMLQQVVQDRPGFCLHSPHHEARACQLTYAHQAFQGGLDQGCPLTLQPPQPSLTCHFTAQHN